MLSHKVGRQHTHGLGNVRGDEINHGKLGGIGLGGGHGDFGTRPGIKHVVRLVGDGGTHHIYDGHDTGAAALALAQGCKGVGRSRPTG